MASITHLTHAPITEAIIDFKVKPVKEFPSDILSTLEQEIGNIYPYHERRNLFESEIKLAPRHRRVSQSTHEKGLYGYFFKSEDTRNIAQFRVDGFTFNRLKPYTSWNKIFNEAKGLWSVYVNMISPELVTRIAVRYINHLSLPQTPVDNNLSQYLTTPLQIPGDLPKTISNFLVRMTLVDESKNIKANITQALDSNIDSLQIPIIFDIDVYKAGNFEPESLEIWQVFKDLREMKNRIFFNFITEDTVELFK